VAGRLERQWSGFDPVRLTGHAGCHLVIEWLKRVAELL
jgi:hypothetical protein